MVDLDLLRDLGFFVRFLLFFDFFEFAFDFPVASNLLLLVFLDLDFFNFLHDFSDFDQLLSFVFLRLD